MSIRQLILDVRDTTVYNSVLALRRAGEFACLKFSVQSLLAGGVLHQSGVDAGD